MPGSTPLPGTVVATGARRFLLCRRVCSPAGRTRWWPHWRPVALETGRTSWTSVLDSARPSGPVGRTWSPTLIRSSAAIQVAQVGRVQSLGWASGCSAATHRSIRRRVDRKLPRTRGVRVEVPCQWSDHRSQILAPPVARAEWRPLLCRGGSQKPSAASRRGTARPPPSRAGASPRLGDSGPVEARENQVGPVVPGVAAEELPAGRVAERASEVRVGDKVRDGVSDCIVCNTCGASWRCAGHGRGPPISGRWLPRAVSTVPHVMSPESDRTEPPVARRRVVD